MRKDYLIYGDVDTRAFGVGIFGDQLAKAPERDQEFVKVPGRDGDLILDNGRYNNITVSYKAYIIDNYNENIKGLRNALMSRKGYQRLQDTVNPEQYRLAKAIPFEIDEHGVLRAAEFTMQFICKPQRFLVDGDIPIEVTGATSLLNQYEESAKPLIRAYGTGSFAIGDVSVQITSANEYTDIDCELQEAFKDTLATNCNSNIILPQEVFPLLAHGENEITLDGITKLKITPRWWIL